jgi:transketolase
MRIAITEDVEVRFLAYGWNVLRVGHANDIEHIENALTTFRSTKGGPAQIILDSRIGYGSRHKVDTAAGHGDALGEDEGCSTKRAFDWPDHAKIPLPDRVREHFEAGFNGRDAGALERWDKLTGSPPSWSSRLSSSSAMMRLGKARTDRHIGSAHI